MRSLIKFPGGKSYLSKWIISNFPPNYESMIYIEPFGGGGNVLLNKEPSIKEIYNDINPRLYNLFLGLKVDSQSIIRNIQQTNYTKSNFLNAQRAVDTFLNEAGRASRTIIIHRMSRGGLCKDFAWSDRLRGGKPGDVNAWENFQKDLPKIAKRLANIEVYNKTFEEILEQYINNPNVLWYIDPPYMHSTRTSKKLYEFEMGESQHCALAFLLNICKGKVIISGYESDLYNGWYNTWRVSKKEMANHSGQNKKKNRRTEMLWMNY